MPETTKRTSPRTGSSAGSSNARSRGKSRGKSSPGKGARDNGASEPAGRGKDSAKPRPDAGATGEEPSSPGRLRRAMTAARSSASDSGPQALRRAARAAIERARDAGGAALRVRSLPIQRSIDVAVPLPVAWDEWIRLDFLPEGAHRVRDIERDDDAHLVGRLSGPHAATRWEAQVVDERVDESFAWRSEGASDCAGLVTFHRIGDRLTRLELQLDVVPRGLTEAAALLLRLADHRAEADLRGFKARIETIDPDEYAPVEDEERETAAHQEGESV